MSGIRRIVLLGAAAAAACVLALAVTPARASAACVSFPDTGGVVSGRFLYGPIGQTFAAQVRVTVTDVNALPWWGTVQVWGASRISEVDSTMYLWPWASRTVYGPVVIAQQYLYWSVGLDPISDATSLGVQVCD
jgi:hypothetical protein